MSDPETCSYEVEHYVKFEACLTWPDGATRSPLGLKDTRVVLYRKADLQGLVDSRAAANKPLTWQDALNHGGDAYVAAGEVDTASGYLYFSEEGSGDEGTGLLEFKEITAWPTAGPEGYYLAVEGCAVLLPLWRVETVTDGVPQKHSSNHFADGYLIDAAAPTCLLELELQEKEVKGNVVLVWKSEVAFARRSGNLHSQAGEPYFRALMDSTWSHGGGGPWPGEDFSRQTTILSIQVLPLAVASPDFSADPETCAAQPTSAPLWESHPAYTFTPHAHVLDVFNLPATRPQLEWGLNVDAQGRPDRVPMVPGAVLDLSHCPGSKAEILDHVWVRFFEFGLRAAGGSYANITLRTLAFNRLDVEQVPFGDAVCFDASGDSRVRTWNAAGYEVISPIMPQYTLNVHAGEDPYDPMKWVSGGILTSAGLLVDCSLRSGNSGRRGGGGSGTMNAAYENDVAHHSWSPSVDAVRKLYYYHVDYFRKGGTPGVYSSARGSDSHDHKGVDFYGFCHGGFSTSSTELQGEPMYAMRRCRARFRKSGPDGSGRYLYYFYLVFKPDGSWRQIDYMHAYKTPGPATAHMTKGESSHFHMVWAGAFLGWSGSSGNADGPGVTSKHLHMYYHEQAYTSVPGMVGAKKDPADMFRSGTSVSSNAAHRRKNHYPWVKGRVKNSHDRTFKKKQIKLIAYDRRKSSPLTTTDAAQTEILAVTTVRDDGKFELYIPPDRDVRLLITRAHCDVVNVADTSDCVDHEQDLRYAPDPKYNASGEDLGDIKLEYAQHITGRVVDAAGEPVADYDVEIVEVATTKVVGKIQSDDEGNFTAKAPAGLVKLKIGTKTHEIPARTAGVNHAAGDLTNA